MTSCHMFSDVRLLWENIWRGGLALSEPPQIDSASLKKHAILLTHPEYRPGSRAGYTENQQAFGDTESASYQAESGSAVCAP